ncbi:MAG TPA: SEC-C metal-binding domain-containing protein [Hyphomicrobiaceae bacterium]|nr:SEC-C metal-binding domain-containing protein [Hyphomicrobiaceae bacterium]
MSAPSPKSQSAPAHEPHGLEAEHVHGPHCAHDHDHHHHHHHHGPSAPFVRAHKKVGRNEPCPCGSGKKYKKCCLNAVA